jgi:hypothetical protein
VTSLMYTLFFCGFCFLPAVPFLLIAWHVKVLGLMSCLVERNIKLQKSWLILSSLQCICLIIVFITVHSSGSKLLDIWLVPLPNFIYILYILFCVNLGTILLYLSYLTKKIESEHRKKQTFLYGFFIILYFSILIFIHSDPLFPLQSH